MNTAIELASREYGNLKDALASESQGLATNNGELALAAICYATPVPVFVVGGDDDDATFADPWPWGVNQDLRQLVGERKGINGVAPADPDSCTIEERIELLGKAAALILHEILRLQQIA